jgi:hypothetical protein
MNEEKLNWKLNYYPWIMFYPNYPHYSDLTLNTARGDVVELQCVVISKIAIYHSLSRCRRISWLCCNVLLVFS